MDCSPEKIEQAATKWRNGIEVNANFSLIYLCLRSKIFTFLNRNKFISPGEAEELTQEVFIRVFNNRDGFRGESSIRRWVLVIARNFLFSYIRQQQAERRGGRDTETVSLNDPGDADNLKNMIGVEDLSDGSDPLKGLHNAELGNLIKSALMQLPKQQFECLRFYLNGYKVEEIGKMLGITKGGAGANIFQAKKKIREYLNLHRGANI